MTKSLNDISQHEREWEFFKGNCFMSNLLSCAKPKIKIQCPKTFIDCKKMRKPHLISLSKLREREYNNELLKKKLKSIKDREVQNIYIKKDHNYSQSVLKHQKEVIKEIKQNLIDIENRKLNSRLAFSKSFFQKYKSYYNFENKEYLKKKIQLKKNYSYKNSIIIDDQPNINSFFDYLDLNEYLKEKQKNYIILMNSKIYVLNFGLVKVNLVYIKDRFLIIIEPFSSFNGNVFIIIINEDVNLIKFSQGFSDYREIVKLIIFDNDAFVLKNSPLIKFGYITRIMLKEEFERIKKEQKFELL